MAAHAKLAPALGLAVLLSAGPAGAEPRPAGLRPDPTSVEGGLWGLFDKAEQQAKAKAELNADSALNAYVRAVGCKVAEEHCADLRIYVMDRPFFNASMAPNGYSEVWSGLLLRVEDEAQLAFVLGHEFSHFAENHSIEAHQAQKSRANAALALSVGIAVLGAAAAYSAGTPQDAQTIIDATGNLIDVVYLGMIASYFAFSREHESEADRLGLGRISEIGYSAEAGAGIWRAMQAEAAVSDFPRVRKSEGKASIFNSHPLSAARVSALSAQAQTLPKGGESGRARHRAAIRPHLARWLRDDLRRRDFGQTLHLLDRLARDGEDLGVINFYRGEGYRLRRGDGDLARAREAYLAAVAHADAPPAAWRELGDIRRRDKDAAGARAAYEGYLAKAPQAEDAWLVKDALNSLGGGI